MAKTKAPLFSLEARGALGEAIVYFPWKGINAVRQYVIPTNPKSTLQTSQRNKLTAAVNEFHNAAYSAADMSAWIRYAGTLAKVMTGFNAMCQSHIKAIIANAAAVWNSLSQVTTSNVTAAAFDVSPAKATKADAYKLYYGTKGTYMPNEVADTGTAPAILFALTGLTANTDYYFYIKATAADRVARTGIYKQRTASV